MIKVLRELKIPFRLLIVYAISTLIAACRNFAITGLLAIVGGSILNVVSSRDGYQFKERILLFILCVLVFIVVDTLSIFGQSISLHGILNHIHNKLYEKVLCGRLDSVHQIGQRGELLSRINSDLDMAGSIFGLVLPLMFLISGIGGTVVIAGMDIRLCIGIYAYALLFLAYQTYAIKKERPIILALQENRAHLLGLNMENHRNGLAVKMCNLAEALEKKVLVEMHDFEGLSRKDANCRVLQSAGSTVTDYLQSIGVLLIGFLLYQKGQIMLGDIVILYQMAALIITMVTTITGSYASLQNAMVGFSRLKGILELPQEDRSKPEMEEESAGDSMITGEDVLTGIKADRLSCTLGKYQVFQSLNLQIGSKGLYILTGESGKGKTTLFRLLTGLYPYQQGTLSLFGREIKEYPLWKLRAQIAYCTQENALFEGTIRNNLIWRSENITDERIWDLLKKLSLDQWILGLRDGLDTRISNGGMEFSGGQRKSLLLARTLLEEPQVYLLDEVFAGIDQKHIEIMLEELKERARHALIVLITHDPIVVDQCREMEDHIVTI